MELVPQMVHMRSPGRGLLRAAMAVVFGFMSLVHGPVMTFAKASPAPAHHASHHGAHHDHAAPAEESQPPVCYAFGCFIALEALALREPAAILNPIGVLSPALADALRAEDIEPAVPPPRLHV
jgi:hypothetical protein